MATIEPTDEMLEAGAKMFQATLHSAADFKHHAYHIFTAMMAIAPGRYMVPRLPQDLAEHYTWDDAISLLRGLLEAREK